MDYMKKAIWGEDPKEQQRKIRSIIRKNKRSLDKTIRDLDQLKSKTKALIKQSYKKNDLKGCRIYAKELYNINKQYNRMYTSKANLESINLKIEEAYRMKILSNQMISSINIMNEVNSLIHLPQLQSSMIELEKELMKNGMINEMIDDTLENIDTNEEEEEEVENEVNKIIEEFTNEKFSKIKQEVPTNNIEVEATNNDKEIDEEADTMLNEMRERLKALQS